MERNKRSEQETLDLILKIWVLFLIGLHALGFVDESYFPGFRDEPLAQEEIIWKAQKVIFFGFMFLGFLTDILQMRIERSKAYQFLFLSLLLGTASGFLSAYQYKLIYLFFGRN